ncbi:carbohydrate kinase family protein [Desulforhopalus sp. IMCC35007]|uniref:carbohydrate kinase family protein n=1 Tax=Desulforhopalus sp. IMCC35007 TaxID=2569543 RepID=UPI0010ADDC9B|nr:carbohydrate kinase family protein [Desulforhopalus sp. IMCC35007]TKB09879.1 carbohydrate kinase family protein [Desulforhopalus sp. IMCC35007]
MKNVIISGSLAYDRIMNFSDNFSDHILPDKIHSLNVCFQVDGVTENYGGTAGNIAYALNLMGVAPQFSATIGSDHHKYFEWLKRNNIATDGIKVIDVELTAGAYITTDISNNQITGFNPGAMKYSSGLDVAGLSPEEDLLLVSPGNLDDMINYPKQCKKLGIEYIFDPGQALPMLQGKDLVEVISGCSILIVNDYEFNLIQDKTGCSKDELLKLAHTTIVTLGDNGSELYNGTGMTPIKAFKAARVVDPTGAGDAFRGGLISGLLKKKSLKESATLGSVCASFAVESNGTQVYSFTPEEFNRRATEG